MSLWGARNNFWETSIVLEQSAVALNSTTHGQTH